MTTSLKSGSVLERRPAWRPCCEPGLCDDLGCEAGGCNEQAEYDAGHDEEPDSARAPVETAGAACTRVCTTAKPLEAWRKEEQGDTPRELADRCDEHDAGPGSSRIEDHRAQASALPEPSLGDETQESHGGRVAHQPGYRDERGRHRAP